MEKNLLPSHEETCTKKPKFCQFCNCEIVGDEFTNHVYQCGSRTKKCSYCNKNILVRGIFFKHILLIEAKILTITKSSVKLVSITTVTISHQYRKTRRNPGLNQTHMQLSILPQTQQNQQNPLLMNQAIMIEGQTRVGKQQIQHVNQKLQAQMKQNLI